MANIAQVDGSSAGLALADYKLNRNLIATRGVHPRLVADCRRKAPAVCMVGTWKCVVILRFYDFTHDSRSGLSFPVRGGNSLHCFAGISGFAAVVSYLGHRRDSRDAGRGRR